MNQTILQTLFLDNPGLPAEIARFCESLPKYTNQELKELVGYERFNHFEEAVSWHMAAENRAHYLFGLNLRRKLLEELVG